MRSSSQGARYCGHSTIQLKYLSSPNRIGATVKPARRSQKLGRLPIRELLAEESCESLVPFHIDTVETTDRFAQPDEAEPPSMAARRLGFAHRVDVAMEATRGFQ
jgi:hypothetical protein